MTRFLRLVVALMLLAPTVVCTAGQSVLAQDESPPELDARAEGVLGSYADQEIHQGLVAADLVGEWLDAGGVSPQAALVEVAGSGDYLAQRLVLLEGLARLADRASQIDERTNRAERLLQDLDTLEELAAELQRTVEDRDSSSAIVLNPDVVTEARRTLAGLNNGQHPLGFSLDPLVLVDHGLARTRVAVERQIDLFTAATSGAAVPAMNTADDTQSDGFGDAIEDLVGIRRLIESTVQSSLSAQVSYDAERQAVIATMPALHQMRHLSPTSVDGLTVVTLDAYVRGADILDASCPVDWALLAGVGRVESRHGTIDDTVVQDSGQVSKPILGPLLDGGASQREAAEAAAAEVAAAEAAEALRLAEIEAELAAEEARLRSLDVLAWGEVEAERRAEERKLAREEAQAAEADSAAVPEPEIEAPAPRFDPQLWGDDSPFEEEELLSLESDSVDDGEFEQQEPEVKGNGFAVIVDTDNGTLDGNSSWDRAVGPMQFIPETWSYWDTDGNGDGVIDPQNLYDAAASAGRFLCHLSTTRGASPSSFLLGYNSSDVYVRNVVAAAENFAAAELPSVTQITETTEIAD